MDNNIIQKIENDIFLKENNNDRFRNTFNVGNKTYFYTLFDSVFLSQLYRVYSLLAKNLNVPAAEYDYLKRGSKIVLFSKSVVEKNERMFENLCPPDMENLFSNWDNIIEGISKKHHIDLKGDFYRQIFFSLLIYDQDKNVELIRNNNGNIRLSPYFDYSGVYSNHDGLLEVDNNIFYDLEVKNDYFIETNSNEVELERDLNLIIEKELITYLENNSLLDYDLKLQTCLKNLDIDFIHKCLNIDILKIIDMDKEHIYSNNFKKVINIMFKNSQSLLKNKILEKNITKK